MKLPLLDGPVLATARLSGCQARSAAPIGSGRRACAMPSRSRERFHSPRRLLMYRIRKHSPGSQLLTRLGILALPACASVLCLQFVMTSVAFAGTLPTAPTVSSTPVNTTVQTTTGHAAQTVSAAASSSVQVTTSSGSSGTKASPSVGVSASVQVPATGHTSGGTVQAAVSPPTTSTTVHASASAAAPVTNTTVQTSTSASAPVANARAGTSSSAPVVSTTVHTSGSAGPAVNTTVQASAAASVPAVSIAVGASASASTPVGSAGVHSSGSVSAPGPGASVQTSTSASMPVVNANPGTAPSASASVAGGPAAGASAPAAAAVVSGNSSARTSRRVAAASTGVKPPTRPTTGTSASAAVNTPSRTGQAESTPTAHLPLLAAGGAVALHRRAASGRRQSAGTPPAASRKGVTRAARGRVGHRLAGRHHRRRSRVVAPSGRAAVLAARANAVHRSTVQHRTSRRGTSPLTLTRVRMPRAHHEAAVPTVYRIGTYTVSVQRGDHGPYAVIQSTRGTGVSRHPRSSDNGYSRVVTAVAGLLRKLARTGGGALGPVHGVQFPLWAFVLGLLMMALGRICPKLVTSSQRAIER